MDSTSPTETETVSLNRRNTVDTIRFGQCANKANLTAFWTDDLGRLYRRVHRPG